MPTLGILVVGDKEPFFSAFEEELRRLGYVPGQSIQIVFRGAEGQPTTCSLFARIPGDWKYDWIDFRNACRKSRFEGPQLLKIERA